MASQTFFAMGFGGSDWSAVRRCTLSADWPAGESCVPEEARGAAGRSPLRGVPEEAAGDAPSAPAQGGDGRRLQGKKGDTNRKEKGGLGLLAGPSSNGLSRANVCGATQLCHVSFLATAWPRAFQRGSLVAPKACGSTLQGVAPRSLARPKGIVFGNLDLHELLLKY